MGAKDCLGNYWAHSLEWENKKQNFLGNRKLDSTGNKITALSLQKGKDLKAESPLNDFWFRCFIDLKQSQMHKCGR